MSKTRSVLGKGLSALIPGASSMMEEEELGGKITLDIAQARVDSVLEPVRDRPDSLMNRIEIAKVAPNPLQPRKEFPRESLEELARSIREHGVIQAITVRKAGPDRYELISGERRVRAAIEAGLTDIPAYVIEAEGDRKMLELAIIENVQRLQFNPVEEAEAYQRLIEDCGLTQEEVAEKISRDRTTVANFIRLLRLPDRIKDSLRAGELGLGHAKAVLAVPDPSKQIALWEEALERHYSVRKLEEQVKKMQTAKERTSKPRDEVNSSPLPEAAPEPSNDVTAIENTFKQILGTHVKVRLKSDHAGEITIQFYSYDDLERLQDLLGTIQHV